MVRVIQPFLILFFDTNIIGEGKKVLVNRLQAFGKIRTYKFGFGLLLLCFQPGLIYK